MILREPCTECGAKGYKIEVTTRISKNEMRRHMKEHAYIQGADCDCMRVSVSWKRVCVRCGGSGIMVTTVERPQVGNRVVVRSSALLDRMGIPEYKGQIGTVIAINDPKIDSMQSEPVRELRMTANVTWQETNYRGQVTVASIKENKGIETWGFLPRELKIVK